MKLIKEVKGFGKNAIVYGKPGHKIELVNGEDQYKLSDPDNVVVVKPMFMGHKSVPFSCYVRDIDQNG